MQRRRRLIRQAISVSVLCVSLAGCAKSGGEVFETAQPGDAWAGAESRPAAMEAGEDGREESADLYVYVCGQVARPGVYRLRAGARVAEALERAGGMTGDAAPEYLNLAQTLADGEKVYLPSRKEAERGETAEGMPPWPAGVPGDSREKVNLNTADKRALMSLSGIGESRAEEILAYRRDNGPFRSAEEIKNVSGIGEGIFSRIKDQITV